MKARWKQWLCFLLFAGHDYEIILTEPTYAVVRCRKKFCRYVKRM